MDALETGTKLHKLLMDGEPIDPLACDYAEFGRRLAQGLGLPLSVLEVRDLYVGRKPLPKIEQVEASFGKPLPPLSCCGSRCPSIKSRFKRRKR